MRIISVDSDAEKFIVRREVDGVERVHLFPLDTLEWRAAEYEIDPADRQTLLEIVLYEPLLDGHSHEHPKHLYRAGSIAEAREYHLGRIAALKAKHPLVDAANLLDAVRTGCAMHPEAISLKRAHVQIGRRRIRAELSRKAGDPEAERIAALRRLVGSREVPEPSDPEAGLPPDTNATLMRKDR
jgi:hypothetical protein